MKNKYAAVSLSPYTYLSPSVHTRMYAFLIVLFPQLGMLCITQSWQSIGIVICSVAASLAVVGIDYVFQKKTMFDWLTACVRGIIIGLLIPAGYPLVSVFLIVLCTQLVLRYVLGQFAQVWVNPAALVVAICWLLSVHLFPSVSLRLEDMQTKNIALSLIQNGTFPVAAFDARITAFFNKTIFNLFGVSIPEGYISLFWDSHSIIPAFRFNALTLVSSIFLIACDCVSALIPTVYVVVYLLLVRFVAPLFYGGIVGQGDMLFALLTSGTLFCTLFLLQWCGTTPITLWGKIAYGGLAGLLALLIVGVGNSSAGSIFMILVINVLSPIITAIESAYEKHYLNKVLLPTVQAFKDGQHA